jgi:hypothetical protein
VRPRECVRVGCSDYYGERSGCKRSSRLSTVIPDSQFLRSGVADVLSEFSFVDASLVDLNFRPLRKLRLFRSIYFLIWKSYCSLRLLIMI